MQTTLPPLGSSANIARMSEEFRSRLATLLDLRPDVKVGVSFALRTTSAAILTLLICDWLHLRSPVWAVVSSVVVILPEARGSVANALLRVMANLIGAGSGFVVSLLSMPSLPSLVVGLPAAALLCRLAGIDPAARTASAAVAIVLLKDPDDVRVSSQARVGLVVLGCAVALVVTLLASRIENATARRRLRAREANGK